MKPLINWFLQSRHFDQVLVCLVALLLLAAFVDPAFVLRLSPGCLWTRVFAVHHCWGCGMTRACIELMHGRFTQALQLNPLAIVVAPWVAILYGRWTWQSFGEP